MTAQPENPVAIPALRRALFAWYSANRRDLPWRRGRDPYAIWVSEIMLQQTRVAVVVDRFQAFMARFPTIVALARASEQDVLALWSGLGYYRRARMLHKAAQLVASSMDGKLPAAAAELRTLPGIGAYTAAAIASIAHTEPVAVVDGNVERVLCRLAGWSADGRHGVVLKRKIDALAAEILDPDRPGDHNQAMMELGATVCLPRNPQCLVCPLQPACKTRGEHKTAPRPPVRTREVAHALALRTTPDGRRAVLLEQRSAAETVMPGLWELPALCPTVAALGEPRMTLRHSIMQVNYSVRIHPVGEEALASMTIAGGQRRWVPLHEAGSMALTGLARKVLSRLPEAGVS